MGETKVFEGEDWIRNVHYMALLKLYNEKCQQVRVFEKALRNQIIDLDMTDSDNTLAIDAMVEIEINKAKSEIEKG